MRRANPYFSNPGFAEGVSNLAVAINGDPAAAAQRASRDFRQVQTTRELMEAKNLSGLQQAINNFTPGGEGGPSARDIVSLSAGAGRSSQDAAVALRALTANEGGSDSALARAVLGAGGAVGPDSAFSIEDRDAVAARNDTADLRQATSVAGINNAGALERLLADPKTIAGNAIIAGDEVSPLIGALAAGEAGRKAGLGAPAFAPGDGASGIKLTDLDTLDGEIDVMLGISEDGGPALPVEARNLLRTEIQRLMSSGTAAADAVGEAVNNTGRVRTIQIPGQGFAGFGDEEDVFVPFSMYDDRGETPISNLPDGYAVTVPETRSPLAAAIGTTEIGTPEPVSVDLPTASDGSVVVGDTIIGDGEVVMQDGVAYRNVGGRMEPAI